jgi:hypothetical protein
MLTNGLLHRLVLRWQSSFRFRNSGKNKVKGSVWWLEKGQSGHSGMAVSGHHARRTHQVMRKQEDRWKVCV